jgi:hypothetical protein
MKLSTLTAMLKSRTVKILAATALAGAALTAAVPAAQAQRVYFGVHVGPRYVAPAPVVVYGYHRDWRYNRPYVVHRGWHR